MIVQIYEVSNPEEAKGIEKLGVDHIGVLVGKRWEGLTPEEVKNIFRVLSKKTKKVALTLSNNLKEIFKIIEKTHPNILHIGTSPKNIIPEDLKDIKKKFPSIKIIRTIPVIDIKSIKLAKKYDGIADYLLLDSKEKSQIGATGKTHDWQISKKIVESIKIPVILAGGLGPDNVEKAIKTVSPAGVDSKTKTDKTNTNQKDLEKVKEFVIKARSI